MWFCVLFSVFCIICTRYALPFYRINIYIVQSTKCRMTEYRVDTFSVFRIQCLSKLIESSINRADCVAFRLRAQIHRFIAWIICVIQFCIFAFYDDADRKQSMRLPHFIILSISCISRRSVESGLDLIHHLFEGMEKKKKKKFIWLQRMWKVWIKMKIITGWKIYINRDTSTSTNTQHKLI